MREFEVTAVRERQLWAVNTSGEVVRAWCPSPAGTSLSRRIEVFVGEAGAIDGWHDPVSAAAVDQRLIAGQPAHGSLLHCVGRCRRRWLAPAAAAILTNPLGCLGCGGALVAADPPAG